MGNKTSKLATPDAKNYFSRTFKLETPQFKYFAKKKYISMRNPVLSVICGKLTEVTSAGTKWLPPSWDAFEDTVSDPTKSDMRWLSR